MFSPRSVRRTAMFSGIAVGASLALEHATNKTFSDNYYVVYDLGDENPKSNAEALSLIKNDESIATRSFQTSSDEGSDTRLHVGSLATISSHAERVVVSQFLRGHGFADEFGGSRSHVRISGQDFNMNGTYTFDCGECPDQGTVIPGFTDGPLSNDSLSLWDQQYPLPGASLFLSRSRSMDRCEDLTFISLDFDGDVSVETAPFLVEYRQIPTPIPTAAPTEAPTEAPTALPSAGPTPTPTMAPTPGPSLNPTEVPSSIPTEVPTLLPTATPTFSQTAVPTATPTPLLPSADPTVGSVGSSAFSSATSIFASPSPTLLVEGTLAVLLVYILLSF